MMAKGKHAARAEARNLERLDSQVQGLRTQLAKAKIELSVSRKEVTRLQAIEGVFDTTKNVIAELEVTKRELADVHGKNLVLNERLKRWAEVLIADRNKELMALNRDMWADLCELGYVHDEFKNSRASRRNTRSGHAARKIFKTVSYTHLTLPTKA